MSAPKWQRVIVTGIYTDADGLETAVPLSVDSDGGLLSEVTIAPESEGLFSGRVAPADPVLHRYGITAVDSPNYPPGSGTPTNSAGWVENTDQRYNNAKVHVNGATWAADDTSPQLEFTLWRRSVGGGVEQGGTFLVSGEAKQTAILTNQGAITWQDDGVIDADQSNFDQVRPLLSGDPSQYIFTAEPGDFVTAPIWGWPTYGGVPPALQIANGHISTFDENDVQSNVGWVGGSKPTTEAAYSVRVPNINWTDNFEGLAGADFAVTLKAKTGTGFFVADVAVVLY